MKKPNAWVASTLSIVLLYQMATAQVARLVSISSAGVQSNSPSNIPFVTPQVMTPDGRFVAFYSFGSNLVNGDTNQTDDVFLRDTQLGTTERISTDSNGIEGNQQSGNPGLSISANGRFVAFNSWASNLTKNDTNGTSDIFLRDRLTATTTRISVSSNDEEANGSSTTACISADGRYVAFSSEASNLVSDDTNGENDIFVRDLTASTTERINIGPGGVQANDSGSLGSISADGRYVAFYSFATNLVQGGTNGHSHIFVRDRLAGTTELISINTMGEQADGVSLFGTISSDGQYVAFTSTATNLDPVVGNGHLQVYLRDRGLGTTERASVGVAGAQGNSDSQDSWVSTNGQLVLFWSSSTNLVNGDTNARTDVFFRDRYSGITERVSLGTGGVQGNGNSNLGVSSADGRFVAFASGSSNLVPGDNNQAQDIFVYDRNASGFISTCTSGISPVRICPCGNPPGADGRGCDNSSGTGGALLSAGGVAYLSNDSLMLRAVGERSTALSILMQGNGVVSNGVTYGQGVRCVGGTIIRRLFIKHALGGSITAPDLPGGDPTVSARSSAKGDVIHAGDSRYYLVYYRDPVVLGGCPSSSTFNCTQTGMVTWSP